MPNCVRAVLNCFKGNHLDCEEYTHQCKQRRRYVYQYLPVHCGNNLKFTEDDKEKLYKVIIEGRVSENILRGTRLMTDETEAMNSAFRTTNPKHSSTYSRNAK